MSINNKIKLNDSAASSSNTVLKHDPLIARVNELKDWSESKAREKAENDGMTLKREHFQVMHLLRLYFLVNGKANNGRELDNMLAQAFEHKGGRKYLHKLFPKGPVAQGMRYAGLSVPAYTFDKGCGTAR